MRRSPSRCVADGSLSPPVPVHTLVFTHAIRTSRSHISFTYVPTSRCAGVPPTALRCVGMAAARLPVRSCPPNTRPSWLPCSRDADGLAVGLTLCIPYMAGGWSPSKGGGPLSSHRSPTRHSHPPTARPSPCARSDATPCAMRATAACWPGPDRSCAADPDAAGRQGVHGPRLTQRTPSHTWRAHASYCHVCMLSLGGVALCVHLTDGAALCVHGRCARTRRTTRAPSRRNSMATRCSLPTPTAFAPSRSVPTDPTGHALPGTVHARSHRPRTLWHCARTLSQATALCDTVHARSHRRPHSVTLCTHPLSQPTALPQATALTQATHTLTQATALTQATHTTRTLSHTGHGHALATHPSSSSHCGGVHAPATPSLHSRHCGACAPCVELQVCRAALRKRCATQRSNARAYARDGRCSAHVRCSCLRTPMQRFS
jgi:hypothetical protein